MTVDEIKMLECQLNSQRQFTFDLAQKRVDLARRSSALKQELESVDSEIRLLDTKGRNAALELERLEKAYTEAHNA